MTPALEPLSPVIAAVLHMNADHEDTELMLALLDALNTLADDLKYVQYEPSDLAVERLLRLYVAVLAARRQQP